MQTKAQHFFHDCPVTDFSLKDGTMHIGIKTYDDETKSYTPRMVTFHGVGDVRIDNVPDENIGVIYREGEVLTFKTKDNRASLLLKWDDRPRGQSTMKAYAFGFSRMDIDGEPVGPAENRP